MPLWLLIAGGVAVLLWARRQPCPPPDQGGQARGLAISGALGPPAGDLAAPTGSIVPWYGPVLVNAGSRLIGTGQDQSRRVAVASGPGGQNAYPSAAPVFTARPFGGPLAETVAPQPTYPTRLPQVIEPTIVPGGDLTPVVPISSPALRVGPATLPLDTISFAQIVGGGQGLRKRWGAYS